MYVYDLNKGEILQVAIQLLREENITVVETARELSISENTLQKWLDEYQREHGTIHGGRQQGQQQSHITYSPEQQEDEK